MMKNYRYIVALGSICLISALYASANIGSMVPRYQFFEDIMKTTYEPGRFAKEINFIQQDQEIQYAALRYAATKNNFLWGTFSTASLKTLRAKKTKERGGSLNVILAYGPKAEEKVDIGGLQASLGMESQKRGKRLTVQVASNANCLETTSSYDTPTTITRYINDPTQGPAAAISAAPGTIWRHYFIFKDGIHTQDAYGTSQAWRQGRDFAGNNHRQLCIFKELFDQAYQELGVMVPVHNGYPLLPLNSQKTEQLAHVIAKHHDLLKIGVHTDITVTHGLRQGNNHQLLAAQERPLINQVFCTAIDLNGTNDGTNPEAQKIAKTILQAQIEATILAAMQNNSDTLLLTMLGCGVFGNDPLWIIEALEKLQDLITTSGMRIILNLFNGKSLQNPMFKARLTSLVDKTEGTSTVYRQQGETVITEQIHSDANQKASSETSSQRICPH